jgi:hypothetical protein
VAELTKDWDEVMPSNGKVLHFGFGGIYNNKAVLDIEEFLQTPQATTGIAISLVRQSIHTGIGSLEPGHLFTELEDIEWTLWGQWTDFAETYGRPASITIFSLLCLRLLTWAGGLFCRCVALSKLYKWTTTGLAACFPSFMACLLARQEGSKRKPTKDDRYRQLNMARNCPREHLVITREADPIFFDPVKNEHYLRNGSRSELHPEVMAKFVPFLQKQANLTRKRTKSLDSTNWTESLGHAGALNNANPKDGNYHRYGSVDSDILDYVNRNEVDTERMKTIRKKRKLRQLTPSPPPLPKVRLPGLEVGTIDEPLPCAPLMANMGREMVNKAAPTLQRVVEPPRIPPPPQARRETWETIKRI